MARKTPPPAPGSTVDELRQAVREGRELLRDLKEERKKIEALLNNGAEAVVDRALARQVEILGNSAKKAMDDSVKKIHRSFDRLEAQLMGTTHQDRRNGDLSLQQVVDLLGKRRQWLDLIEGAGDDPVSFAQAVSTMGEWSDCVIDPAGNCIEHGFFYKEDKETFESCPVGIAKEVPNLLNFHGAGLTGTR